VVAEEQKSMLDIERFVGQKIRRLKLDGFPYVYTALFEEGKDGKGGTYRPIKGFRTSKGYSYGRARR
jgi:ATP-dependent RNA helicase RhlE